MASIAIKLASLMILVVFFVQTTSAVTYTVGDKTGWTIPPSASFYTNWVAKQSFKAGDILVFNFPVGAHTVAEVSKTAYDSCTTNNVLSAVKSTAPANYTLSSAGTHYFICTITGHCSAGQKISIPVSPATSSSSPPASAPAPASSKKTPSPVSTPTSAPSPATSAATTSPAPSPATSAASTSPAPSPAKSTGGAPTPAPSPATGGSTTPAPAPATGTTASPPSPTGPSPTAGSVPTPASGPSGGAAASEPASESTPPPSAAPAVGGFGLLGLFSMVVLSLF